MVSLRWSTVASVGIGLVLLTVVLPHTRITASLYIAIGVAAVLAIVVAASRLALPRRGAWVLLAASVAVSAVGDAIWYVFEFRGIEPFPSVADGFYLAAYPLMATALWRFTSRAASTRGALPDALIVAVAGTVVGWVFLLAPYAGDPTLTRTEQAFSLAYPIADLLLLLLLARLVFDHGARMPVHLIVLVGVGFHLIADVVFGLAILDGLYVGGGVLDSLWLAGYVCFAAAAWHPSARIDPVHPVLGRVESTVAARSSMLSQGRLAVLAIASLIAPVIILVYGDRDPTTVRVAAAGAVVLGLLVLHRMAGLTHSIAELVTDLDQASNTDPLTGAANRRQLDQRLASELARSDRHGTPLSFVMIDLDHFKRFNDTYGHQAGDTLLREAVARWHRELRGADLLVRFGGEEFVIVFVDSPPGDAEVAVERLRSVVPFGASCSAGLAHHTPGESSESLILRADLALYRAKSTGRDRTVVAAPDVPASRDEPEPVVG